ncbi:hypothetical protein FRC01_003252 [Tulasnella sp. 417]|nr:hypothetical protein FRC01_003252 [Tulasnella sp. 417]
MDIDASEPSNSQLHGTRPIRDRFYLTRTPPDSDWDQDKEWTVEEITDHYIPQTGSKWYKVAWEEWTRDDGSNTTWVPQPELLDQDENELELVSEYNQARRTARLQIQPDLKGTEDLIQEKDINPFRFPEEQIGWLSLRTVESRLPRGRKSNIQALEDELLRLERAATETHEMAEKLFGPTNAVKWEAQEDIEIRELSFTIKGDSPPNILSTSSELSYDSRPPEEYALEMDAHGLRPKTTPPLGGPAQVKMDPDYDPDLGIRPRPERSSPDIIVISDDSSDGAGGAAPRGRFKSLSLLDQEPSFGDTLQTYIEDGDIDDAIEPETTRRACGEARLLVQVDWDEATTTAGARRVEIVNDDSDDDEDCPALPMGFKYQERGYQIEICDVMSPASCACQSYSEFNDRYAYDRLGLFLDNNKDENGADAEVFECTSTAGSYKPIIRSSRERAEALEKSRRREWARRNDPEVRRYSSVTLDRRGYIFDLDCRELDGEGQAPGDPPSSPSRLRVSHKRYSIDAWACGNWTRFINHSCQPNMKVYTAYHDLYDHENPPPGKLIFVTTRDIHVGEELTIDYDPRSSEIGRGSQRKARHKGNLNVYEMSRRQFKGSQRSSSRGELVSDSAGGSSATLVDGSEPDLVPCHCDAPVYVCRRFIKI